LLFEYAEKLNHTIILQEVVEMEVKAHAKRIFESTLSECNRAIEKAERLGISNLNEIDVHKELKDVLQEWDTKFSTTLKHYRVKRIPTDPGILPELIRRATERLAPCDIHGKETRDAMIWLNMCHFLQSANRGSAVFISSNVKDFASDDSQLRKELAEEVQQRGIEIRYYNNLTSFNSDHAAHFSYLNAEWIDERIDHSEVENMIEESLIWSDKAYFRITNLDYSDNYSIEKIEEITHVSIIGIDDPILVWDIEEPKLFVNIGVEAEVEAGAEGKLIRPPYRSGYTDDMDDDFPLSKYILCNAHVYFHIDACVEGDAIKLMDVAHFDSF
jgi:hypothetical protein